MDPLGFGLENFNAIGAWRTDGKMPLDVSGALPDGRSFQTPAQLKALLKGDRDAYVRGLTEKLPMYAMGRGLERFDRPAVTAVAAKLASQDYKFSPLVLDIVNSLPFQMRQARETTQVASKIGESSK